MLIRVAAALLCALSAVLVPMAPALAATSVVARPDVASPAGLAYDDVAHRLYAAGSNGTLTALDAADGYAELSETDLTCCLDAVAVNSATHRVYVSGNGVVVYDGTAQAVEAVVPVAPGSPEALAIDAAANRIYVALPNIDAVGVIDGATNLLVGTIPTADNPKGIAAHAGKLYVASRGEHKVQVIDVATAAVINEAPIPTARALALDATNGWLAVARDNGIVHVLNATTLAQRFDFVAGGNPRGLVFNPTTKRLWVTGEADDSLTIVRSTDGIVLGRLGLGDQPGFIGLEQSTGRVAIAQRGVSQLVILQETLGAVRIDFPLPGAFVGPNGRIVQGVAPPGATVGVYEGSTEVGRALADVRGNWSVTIPFAQGPHTIYAIAADEQSSAPRSFTADLTPPGIAYVFRTPLARGIWNNGPVVTRFSCSDALSGPVATSVERTNYFDGRNQTSTGECRDTAGNRSILVVPDINIDQTPPSVSLTRTPPANIWGWHRVQHVAAKFACVDTLSGMDGMTTYEETVSGDTGGRIVRFSCRDKAGNVRNSEQVVRIDLGMPVASLDQNHLPIVMPSQPPVVFPVASWIQGTANDPRSGPFEVEVRIVDQDGVETIMAAQCSAGCGTGTIRWRVTPPILPAGIYNVSARSTDYAGNIGPWSGALALVIITSVEPPASG